MKRAKRSISDEVKGVAKFPPASRKPTKFIYEGTDDIIVANGGQAIIGCLLDRTNICNRFDKLKIRGQKFPQITNGDIALSMIALLSQGKTDYENITEFRNDPFLHHALGIPKLPSEGTLRQRLNALGRLKDFALRIPREEIVRLLAYFSEDFHLYFDRWIPLDIDVTPFDNSDTKKEGVSWTYKNFDGFAPIIAYLGIEGFFINSELRPGSQHCQNGTPEFIKTSLLYAKSISDATPLVRLDSGNDSVENIKVIREAKADWIIKRNRRSENLDWWLEVAKSEGHRQKVREGKTIWRGVTELTQNKVTSRVVSEVTERTILKNGECLLFPLHEISTWWTSLNLPPEIVIQLYHEHATSEQFHAELKSEIGLERFPSQKFATNDLILSLAGVAFSCLRISGQIPLWREGSTQKYKRAPIRKVATRRRLRTIMQDLMMMAVKMVRHSRRWFVKTNKRSLWHETWQDICEYLAKNPLVPT